MADSTNTIEKLQTLIRSIIKFGLVSGLATICDFALFTFVLTKVLPVFWAELGAAFVGMIINFFMQKRFVFMLNRKAYQAFFLSITTSVLLMVLGAFAMKGLTEIAFFATHLVIAKILIMGSKFLVNYFTKRWVFEA